MIVEIKDLVEACLVSSGVSEDAIARTGKEARELKTSGKDFFASVITATGGYSDALRAETMVTTEDGKKYVKLRLRRRVPLIVTISGRSEEAVDPVFSKFIEGLPSKFVIGVFEGDIEPDLEEHSDFDAAVSKRYESAVRVVFSIDVGPYQSSTPLTAGNIDIGEVENG